MQLTLVYTDTDKFQPLQSLVPAPLIPAMVKPLIQHQLEAAGEGGIRNCTVIASDGLDAIRKFCGDGSRFGISLQLVSGVPSGSEIPSLLKHRSLFETPLVLMPGRVQARLPFSELVENHVQSGQNLTIIRDENSGELLAFVCSPQARQHFEGQAGTLEATVRALLAADNPEISVVDVNVPYLICGALADVLSVNTLLLNDHSSTPFSTLSEVQPGVRMGHHVSVNPKAVIHPPVAIGDFCQIMSGATIGPDASIGNETIIGKNAIVRNSVVGDRSYIGEMTQVKDSIVAGSTLINLQSGVKVVVTDSFLLDKVASRSVSQAIDSLVHKAAAFGLLGALATPWLATKILSKKGKTAGIQSTKTLGAGDVSSSEDIEYLPQFEKHSMPNADIPLAWYPTLVNVLQGQMRFVGPGPVSPEEAAMIESIGYENRFLVPPGLIAIEDLFGENVDEARIAAILYTNNPRLTQDLRIVLARLALPIVGKNTAIRLSGL